MGYVQLPIFAFWLLMVELLCLRFVFFYRVDMQTFLANNLLSIGSVILCPSNDILDNSPYHSATKMKVQNIVYFISNLKIPVFIFENLKRKILLIQGNLTNVIKLTSKWSSQKYILLCVDTSAGSRRASWSHIFRIVFVRGTWINSFLGVFIVVLSHCGTAQHL